VQKRADIADMQRIQLSGTKALIVDDVELNLDVTRGMIEPYGIQVDGVSSGQEAVDIIRKGEPRYDMVFMNRWMPEMDGIEAVRIIREIGDEYTKNLPIIALVANAITGNNAFFINSGFRAVLSRPINVFKLDEIINQLAVKK
jgi:CheY-like chemotaxis protein